MSQSWSSEWMGWSTFYSNPVKGFSEVLIHRLCWYRFFTFFVFCVSWICEEDVVVRGEFIWFDPTLEFWYHSGMYWYRTCFPCLCWWLLYNDQLILEVDVSNLQSCDLSHSTSREVKEFSKDRILQRKIGTKVFQLILGDDRRLTRSIRLTHLSLGLRGLRKRGSDVEVGQPCFRLHLTW